MVKACVHSTRAGLLLHFQYSRESFSPSFPLILLHLSSPLSVDVTAVPLAARRAGGLQCPVGHRQAAGDDSADETGPEGRGEVWKRYNEGERTDGGKGRGETQSLVFTGTALARSAKHYRTLSHAPANRYRLSILRIKNKQTHTHTQISEMQLTVRPPIINEEIKCFVSGEM